MAEDELEEFKQRVRKRVEETLRLEGNPEALSRLEEAEQVLYSQVTNRELEGLIMIQDSLCQKCGECCRRCSPIVITREEVEKIAEFLKVPYKRLRKKLDLKPAGEKGIFEMPGRPCRFLEGNHCSIYPVRPVTCRGFPGVAMKLRVEKAGILVIPAYCSIVEKFFVDRLLNIMFKRKT
jgi:Fe-S-cluster containining protein